MDLQETSRSDGDPAAVAHEFLREVLDAMDVNADVSAEPLEEGIWRIEFVGPDAGDMIGRYGSTLNALQYLTTLVIQKRTGQYIPVLLDAEGYRERRHAALVELARELAGEVARAGQEAELDPLNAFERRIIHNALKDHPDVVTYSEGEEPERRVVIAPRPPAGQIARS